MIVKSLKSDRNRNHRIDEETCQHITKLQRELIKEKKLIDLKLDGRQ